MLVDSDDEYPCLDFDSNRERKHLKLWTWAIFRSERVSVRERAGSAGVGEYEPAVQICARSSTLSLLPCGEAAMQWRTWEGERELYDVVAVRACVCVPSYCYSIWWSLSYLLPYSFYLTSICHGYRHARHDRLKQRKREEKINQDSTAWKPIA